MALTREEADRAVEQLKIYSQPQRLMILSHLLGGEFTVGEIEVATGIVQPALSQQLAALRRAGLVATRRESKQIHYRLADDDVAHCVRGIENQFGRGVGFLDEPAGASAALAAPAGPKPQRGAAVFARILQPGDVKA